MQGLLSALAGAIVLGVVFAFIGPLMIIISTVTSGVLGAVVTLRMLIPKGTRETTYKW